MATQNQIEANRRNAARSTGPQSAAGKRIVSKNAVRHGLLSIEGLLFGENEAEFALFRMRLESELAPVTMVNEIVWLAWKPNRARRMEAALQRW